MNSKAEWLPRECGADTGLPLQRRVYACLGLSCDEVWVFQKTKSQPEHLSQATESYGAECCVQKELQDVLRLWHRLENQSMQSLVLQTSNPGRVLGPLLCVFCIINQRLTMDDSSKVCV